MAPLGSTQSSLHRNFMIVAKNQSRQGLLGVSPGSCRRRALRSASASVSAYGSAGGFTPTSSSTVVSPSASASASRSASTWPFTFPVARLSSSSRRSAAVAGSDRLHGVSYSTSFHSSTRNPEREQPNEFFSSTNNEDMHFRPHTQDLSPQSNDFRHAHTHPGDEAAPSQNGYQRDTQATHATFAHHATNIRNTTTDASHAQISGSSGARSSSSSSHPHSSSYHPSTRPTATGNISNKDVWINMMKRSIAIPVGSMIDRDVRQVIELIKILRTRRTFDRWPDGAQHGFALLDRLAQERQAAGNQPENDAIYPLDVRGLGAVLGFWRKILFFNKNSPHASPLLAQQVLQKIEHYRQVDLFVPNAFTYTILLDCFKHCIPDSELAASLGHDVLQRMLSASQNDPFDVDYHPNALTVANLLYLWGRARRPLNDSVQLFEQLQSWYEQTQRADLAPTLRVYAALVKAHENVRAPPVAMAQWAQQAWDRTLSDPVTGMPLGRRLDVVSLNQILHSLAATKDKDAAETVYQILQSLLSAYRTSEWPECRPSQSTFLAALTAFGRTGQVERAEAVMTQLEDLYHETNFAPELRPNKACYGALVWAYVKVGNSAGAEASVVRMSKETDLDFHIWNGVLASWAQAGEADAAERTATVIQWMEKELTVDGEQSENSPLQSSTYNALMGSYARQSNASQGAHLATDLFQWMQEQPQERIRPDGNTYLALITAWKNAGNPEQAESVLRLAMERIKSGEKRIRLDPNHFHLCINAWADSKHPKALEKVSFLFQDMKELGVSPILHTYNCLLRAEKRRGYRRGCASRCLALLNEAKRLAGSGELDREPDIFSYNTVFSVLAKSKDLSNLQHATPLLEGMMKRGVQPDIITYNTLMTMNARRSEPEKVEEILRSMQKAAQEGRVNVRPRFDSYTILLQAWARAGNAQATANILHEMNELYEKGQLEEAPKIRDFNAILQAWLYSTQPEAPTEALRALQNMHELAGTQKFACLPNVYSYNTVISTLLQHRQSKHVMALLHSMKHHNIQPTIVTYCQVLSVLVSGDAPEKDVINMHKVLDEMAARGQQVFDQAHAEGSFGTLISTMQDKDFSGHANVYKRLVGFAEKQGWKMRVLSGRENDKSKASSRRRLSADVPAQPQK